MLRLRRAALGGAPGRTWGCFPEGGPAQRFGRHTLKQGSPFNFLLKVNIFGFLLGSGAGPDVGLHKSEVANSELLRSGGYPCLCMNTHTHTHTHRSLSHVALMVKDLPGDTGDRKDVGLIPGSGRFPWRRAWQPTPVFLPGESRAQGNLVGYCPWGLKDLNTTEAA